MKNLTIPIPQTLYDRIAARAEELAFSPGHLVSLWLWEIERQKRQHGESSTRADASADDGDLSAAEDG